MQCGEPDVVELNTIEMHTGGEPLRIVESGFPHFVGETLLEKRSYFKQHYDQYRKMVMNEPRGHADMFGAVLVPADDNRADIAVMFIQNEGYSDMCGHAVIALSRYLVDNGYVKEITAPVTQVNIQCPCGLVRAFVDYNKGKSGNTTFHSVPAFVLGTDIPLDIPKLGTVKVDISFGGTFYAFISASSLGLDVKTSEIKDIVEAGDAISRAVRKQVVLEHPENPALAKLHGTIITDDNDTDPECPSNSICVFADKQADRSPCGSGTTARVALLYHKGLQKLGETRKFQSGITGSVFTGQPIKEDMCGDYKAIVVEISGRGYYTGRSTFYLEPDDLLGQGFLVK